MATSAPAPIVRKKRNFKALQLNVSKPEPVAAPPPQSLLEPVVVAPTIATAKQPVATRNAPNGRRRPPPMNLVAPKVTATAQTVPGDDNLLTVSTTPNSAPVTGSTSATRPAYHNDLSQKLANMDMNAETRYDLRNEDLKELQELGQGNGGSVKKVMHIPSGKTMAKKVSTSCHPPFLVAMDVVLAFVRLLSPLVLNVSSCGHPSIVSIPGTSDTPKCRTSAFSPAIKISLLSFPLCSTFY